MNQPETWSRPLGRRRFLLAAGLSGLGLGAVVQGLIAPLPAEARGIRRRVLMEDLTLDQPDATGSGTGDSPTIQAALPFTHVGIHWKGAPEAVIGLQTSADGAAWTPWRRLTVERPAGAAPQPDETFAALVGAPRHRFLRVRGPGSGLTAIVATCLNAVDGPTIDESIQGHAPVRALGVHRPLLGVGDFRDGVITREQWGADESLRFGPEQAERWPRAYVAPRAVVVHHTATSTDYQDSTAELRAIYAYHAVTQGFGDIGYHAVIDRDGRLFEGRRGRDMDPFGRFDRDVLSFGVVAGHALTFNYGSVGVALLGNYQDSSPTAAMLERLEEFLTFVHLRHAVDPRARLDFARSNSLWRFHLPALAGHRDCNNTECPGDNVYRRLGDLRETVALRLDGPPGTENVITAAPTERNVWPGRASFSWNGAAPYDCVFEGFRRAPGEDPVTNLLGYDALLMPEHVATAQRSVAFTLTEPGQYTLHLRPSGSPFADRRTILIDRHVVVDNLDEATERHGDWRRSRDLLEMFGSDYELAEPGSGARFVWTARVPERGNYLIQACWTAGPDRSEAAPYTISVSGPVITAAEPTADAPTKGVTTSTTSGTFTSADQTVSGGTWVDLATVDLAPDQLCRVELGAADDGVVVADAVRLVKIGE